MTVSGDEEISVAVNNDLPASSVAEAAMTGSQVALRDDDDGTPIAEIADTGARAGEARRSGDLDGESGVPGGNTE